MYEDYNYGVKETQYGLSNYVTKVFGWMFLGLMITAITAWYTISSPNMAVVLNPIVFIVLALIELGLVIWLAGWINKMSTSTATFVFLLYSLLNGLTLSAIFFVYNIGVIYKAFGVATAVFGVMALYGYFTKNDLTSIGSLFSMGVIGILIALLINAFIRSAMVDLIISFVIVFIFLGLVAYDTQKIKGYYFASAGAEEALKKGAIISALALYIDFINIFLALLRIFGGRD